MVSTLSADERVLLRSLEEEVRMYIYVCMYGRIYGHQYKFFMYVCMYYVYMNICSYIYDVCPVCMCVCMNVS